MGLTFMPAPTQQPHPAGSSDNVMVLQGIAGSEEEEEEMEDMDDEAMFRMDEHVAAVLKARRDAQPSSSRRALTEFKFRALALLDDYVKRCPTSPHLPALLSPLLKAISQAAAPSGNSSGGKQEGAKAGNQPLAARLQV